MQIRPSAAALSVIDRACRRSLTKPRSGRCLPRSTSDRGIPTSACSLLPRARSANCQHASPEVSDRYYNLARSVQAGQRVAAHLPSRRTGFGCSQSRTREKIRCVLSFAPDIHLIFSPQPRSTRNGLIIEARGDLPRRYSVSVFLEDAPDDRRL
jgi:hypothetical protein